jgi:hypothetical protein
MMDGFQYFNEERYAVDAVNDSISQIFVSFDQRLKELDEEKLEIPKATDLAMLKLEALVHLATLEYDGITKADDPFEKFDADGEPYPSKIDSWARGMGMFIFLLIGFSLLTFVLFSCYEKGCYGGAFLPKNSSQCYFWNSKCVQF